MSDFSDFLENEILDHILGTGAYPMPSVFGALHSDHPGETGANEIIGGSLARQAIAFGAAAGGSASNSAQEEWDTTGAASGTAYFVGLWDAVTLGNFLWAVPLGTATAPVVAATFSAQASTDTLTSYGHGYATNDRVYVKRGSGSALPTGLAEDTLYHVVGATADTFQLSTSQGGAAVNLTADGEGIAVRANGRAYTAGDIVRIAAGSLTASID
jgi:hypothetical protein